jgi:shikimate dehydrogenase
MIISGKTTVLGILGHPISHSVSPVMHNAMMSLLNINYVYVPFDVEPAYLETAVKAIRALNIKGVNVTIPHKKQVIPFLDALAPCAKKVGAVNTIVNESGYLVGHNTDAYGFIYGLNKESGFDLKGKRGVVVGAGGAATAIVSALLDQDIDTLYVMNRTTEKARDLLNFYKDNPRILRADWADLNILESVDFIIQTTSVGMNSEENPIPNMKWRSGQLLCDIIYSPLETAFMREAKKQGAIAINGVGMLAGQGVFAFEKFTGLMGSYPLFKQIILRSVQL